MKKILIAVLVSVLCAGLSFAGGREDSSQPQKTITLRLWMGVPLESGPQAVVDAFNAEFKDKGIQVEYERYVNDDNGNLKLETNLLAGSDIDIYASYGGLVRITKRASSGMALDLTDLMKRDNFDALAILGESAVNASLVNGKNFSLPSTLTKTSMLVNKDMFDKAGIPLPEEWTYEEFREIAKKLTSGEGPDKVYGIYWNTQQNIYDVQARMSARTLGGDWIYAPDGKSTQLNNPVIVKTVELMNNTMNVDKTAPTHVDTITQKLTMENMFLTGRAAIIADNFPIRSVKDLKQYPHDFVTAFVPHPVIEKGKGQYTWAVYGDQISINPKSNNIDAAWEFIKWYITKGVVCMADGGRIGLASILNKDEMLTRFFRGAENVIDIESAKKYYLYSPGDKLTPSTITTKAPEIQKVMTEEMEAVFTGKKTPQQGMDDAKKRADGFMK